MHDDQTIQGKGFKSIRASDDQVDALLNALDKSDNRLPTEEKIAPPRYSYRQSHLKIATGQPGESETVYLVPTRTISDEDITFLHGGFLHSKTRCRLELITAHNTWNCLGGTIASCRHVEGSIHEVTIRFDHLIDTSVYARAAIVTRVLLVDDDRLMRRLIPSYLAELNTVVDLAKGGQEGVDQARREIYDVVLMDIEMPGLDGISAVRKLRTANYSGKIYALTARTSQQDRDKCREAGFDGYITKPVSREALAELLDGIKEEPLISNLADDPSMVNLIEEYIKELPTKIRAIEAALTEGNLEQLEMCARTMKGEGTSYGFDAITQAATELEEELARGTSLATIKPKIDDLISCATRARSNSNAS